MIHALAELIPPAIAAIISSSILMLETVAIYAVLLLYVYPRTQDVDVGGWQFAGPLTLSIAFLIVCAALGVGKASETLTTGSTVLGIAAILTAGLGPLLGYKSVKAWAENKFKYRPPGDTASATSAAAGPGSTTTTTMTTATTSADAPRSES